MRREPIVLFDDGHHQCLMFDDLVSGEGVQSNQFLITDHEQYLLLDPGGDLTYTPLSLELSKHIPVQELTYIFASHQDPDIIASLAKWLLHTRAQVICSKLWARFLPHLTANYLALSRGINTFDRIIALPDRGQSFALGQCTLKAVPAHFLHSVGNFQLYDPLSKILFSGDMGASLVDDATPVGGHGAGDGCDHASAAARPALRRRADDQRLSLLDREPRMRPGSDGARGLPPAQVMSPELLRRILRRAGAFGCNRPRARVPPSIEQQVALCPFFTALRGWPWPAA